MEEYLTNIYKESKNKKFATLWKNIQKNKPEFKITQADVKKFLGNLENVQVHKKDLINNSYTASRPLEQFQIDIAYIKKTIKEGDKYKNLLSYENPKTKMFIPKKDTIYALTCIDIFTKNVALRIMKKKDAETTLDALKSILKEMGKPSEIFCDDGSEFKNKVVDKYCQDNDIELIFGIGHAPYVERFHRYLKEELEDHITSSESYVLTPDVFDNVLDSFRELDHVATKMDVDEAKKPENKDEVLKNIQESRKPLKRRPVVRKGDRVRELLKKDRGEKSSFAVEWSKEIYNIVDVIDKYYYLDGGKRDKYLRYMLQKIEGDVKTIKTDPKDEGTRAKRLKELNKQDVIPESYMALNKQKAEADKALAEKIEAIKNRERKKNKKYE